MKVRARFITSVQRVADLPKDGLPEIALLGRSNVGKSSLINAIVEQKGLAKTSSTPGKTQLLNYFLIDESFYFVDMPGYGYAKAGRESRIEWAKLSQQYLTGRKQLKLVGLLIDSRHPGLPGDIAAIEWMAERDIPFAVILTKIDKVKQQELMQHERYLEQLGARIEQVIPTSVLSGKGVVLTRTFLTEVASGKAILV